MSEVHPMTKKALEHIHNLYLILRQDFPPPYLDKSNAGITMRLVEELESKLEDLAFDQVNDINPIDSHHQLLGS